MNIKERIDYIARVKMRNVNAVLKTGSRYKNLNLRVKEVWYDADRYIVCF